MAGGDSFFFYGGFDEVSNLNRDGIFRLNISVDRHEFEERFGYQPGEHADHADEFDYAVLDTVLPHPAYARQAWISILNPGPRTVEQAHALIAGAHDRAAARHKPRSAT